MYYKARERALNNGHPYHIAAILKRRKSIIKIGVNSFKTHPKYMRCYENGSKIFHLHAEMSVLPFSRPGDIIEVFRVSKKKSKEFTMAKPCPHCMHFMKEAGIKEVKYTDWNGVWKRIKI